MTVNGKISVSLIDAEYLLSFISEIRRSVKELQLKCESLLPYAFRAVGSRECSVELGLGISC